MTEGTRGVVGLGGIGCFVFGAMRALYRSFEPHPTKDQGKKKSGFSFPPTKSSGRFEISHREVGV